MIHGTDVSRPILVLDFDGTVCIGDAPVWAYAEAVISELATSRSSGEHDLDADMRFKLEAFLDGTQGSPSYTDGYDAVAQLTGARATLDQLQRAYSMSRQALASGAVAVSAPPGLHDFLSELSTTVERVLVTNAPIEGVLETIEVLGLSDVISRVVTDADKPAGWARLLPALTERQSPANVMVVGDIWDNDIAAPLEFGCATALVDRFGYDQGASHVAAGTLEELYPALREWAADPLGFMSSHPLRQNMLRTPATPPLHRTGTP